MFKELESHVDLLRQRSGEYPLFLRFIEFTDHHFDRLLLESRRWQKVHLVAGFSLSKPRIPNVHFRLLHTLILELDYFHYDCTVDLFQAAPQLRTVHIVDPQRSVIILPYAQLKTVHICEHGIHRPESLSRYYELLTNCTQLQSLTVEYAYITGHATSDSPTLPYLSVPLRYLSLTVSASLSQFRFRAPFLDELHVKELGDFGDMLGFIQQSSCPLRVANLGLLISCTLEEIVRVQRELRMLFALVSDTLQEVSIEMEFVHGSVNKTDAWGQFHMHMGRDEVFELLPSVKLFTVDFGHKPYGLDRLWRQYC